MNNANDANLSTFETTVRETLSYAAEVEHAGYLLHQLEDDYSPEMTKFIEPILQAHKEAVEAAEHTARIRALTDVDNLNLLNDSDEWHDYYIKEVSSPTNEDSQK